MDWSPLGPSKPIRWAQSDGATLSQESEPVINIRAFTLDFLTVFFSFPDRGGAPEDEFFVYKLISATCQNKPWGEDFPILTGVKRKLKCSCRCRRLFRARPHSICIHFADDEITWKTQVLHPRCSLGAFILTQVDSLACILKITRITLSPTSRKHLGLEHDFPLSSWILGSFWSIWVTSILVPRSLAACAGGLWLRKPCLMLQLHHSLIVEGECIILSGFSLSL
jgi:hypothetical protein